MNRRDALKSLLALPIFGKIMAEAKTEAIEVVNTSFKETTPATFKDLSIINFSGMCPTGKFIWMTGRADPYLGYCWGTGYIS